MLTKFIKYIFLLFILIGTYSPVRAQFANDWIVYAQQYFKIKISEEGFYRIDKGTLLSANVPANSIDPRKYRLYRYGMEQPLFIQGENDGKLDNSDYLEFYGTPNDATVDYNLYDSSGSVVNPYHNLYNDTCIYFLTWSIDNTPGKRYTAENDSSYSGYMPASYFIRPVLQQYTSQYYGGAFDYWGISDPEFTSGEGWFDYSFSIGTSISKFLYSHNVFSGGPSATVSLALIGASNDYSFANGDHHLRIKIGNSVVADTSYEAYTAIKFNLTPAASVLASDSTEFNFESIPGSNKVDRNALSYILLQYPHTFSFLNEQAISYKMIIPDQASQSKSYLSINNFAAAGPIALYDLTNNKRIFVQQSGNVFKALVPNSGGNKTCYLVPESSVKYITVITPVSTNAPTYAKFQNIQTLGADSAFVIITHSNLMTEATNYKNYRVQKFNTVLFDISELYNQFAYGIEKHPAAIRNFADFAVKQWSTPPQYLLLIGKAVSIDKMRNDPGIWNTTLVPTCGYPSSDQMLTSRINGVLFEPAIATGRIAARNNAEVKLYLDKVKEYENPNPNDIAWMKNVLHFCGGSSKNESSTLCGFLKKYETTIESTSFGGFVTTFEKNSTAPLQINQSDTLKNLINGGVSIMTFFGHATSTGFDQSTDAPSTYNNKGKYPFILALSCFSGDIHTTGRSTSEEFILIKDKGAIGFLASSGLGFVSPLAQYADSFYLNIGRKNYGTPIGKNILNTFKEVQQNDLYNKSTALEMTLHGDPSIILNAHLQPDLATSDPQLYFTPPVVTTETDSFDVNVIVSNIGKAVDDSFYVEIIRTFPDGSTKEVYKINSAPVYFRDTITLRLPVDVIKGEGLNLFNASIDYYNSISELSELNNQARAELLIQSNDISPVYPFRYAIVPDDTITLVASTSNPFASSKKYLFEVDTTDLFISPAKVTGTVTAPGGVINWKFPVVMTDSTVYYWRTASDSAYNNGKLKWKESSFIYIKNRTGWSQAHFFQFLKGDKYQYVDTLRPQRMFDFVKTVGNLTCNIKASPPETEYKINGTGGDYAGCTYAPSMHIAVIDPVTLVPWGTHFIEKNFPFREYNPTHSFGNANDLGACRNRVENYFIFRTLDSVSMDNMKKMLDSIPCNFYLLAYSVNGGNYTQWPTDVKQKLKDLGANNIFTLKDNDNYIFFVQKCSLTTAVEQTGFNNTDAAINIPLVGNWKDGAIFSETIGPASSWDSLHWRQHPLEAQVYRDSVYLDVIGITSNGTEAKIISQLSKDSTDISISGIDAKQYPYLRLQAFVMDDSLRTPPQLDRWQVIYYGVPEAALNPQKFFSMSNDTLPEGETMSLSVAIENISAYNMDSITVDYWLIDKDRNRIPLTYKKHRPLPAGDTIISTVSLNTKGLAGINSIWIEVNPFNAEHQLEQYHFNNIGSISFLVQKDITNPMLDVTFDNIHILDGDIISAKPHILMQLHDENKFLYLNDSSLFNIYLKKPSSPVAEQITFTGNSSQYTMKWTPAQLPKNSARIDFYPILAEDGIYELIVQARDVSSNASGMLDYKISFEVINRATITNVLNYPNPFSSSTKFIFTLTGSEIPTEIKIQVMTVTGRIVREIMASDFGTLRIGRNVTEYSWDGTDEYGSRLANGLYLYRVAAKMNGSNMEIRPTDADRFFKNGWGKMYLMR